MIFVESNCAFKIRQLYSLNMLNETSMDAAQAGTSGGGPAARVEVTFPCDPSIRDHPVAGHIS